MDILGVSAWYHDAAAALLRDGELVAAAHEERFTRIKFDHQFPMRAIEHCLGLAGIMPQDLEYVVFYEKPLLKFHRLLLTQLATFPRSWHVFREAMLAWFKEKLWIKSLISKRLSIPLDRVLFAEHHLSHAASAMFCSPFDEAAVLSADGVGEWTTTAIGHATADWGSGERTNRLNVTEETRFPHSLGLLYSAFTAWLGFKVNSGEYKVMGMAPYGEPRYVDKVSKLLHVFDDGSFELDMRYFTFHRSAVSSYSPRFVELLGPPREPESDFFTRRTDTDVTGREEAADRNQYYADVAASLQLVLEDVLLKIADHLHKKTGSANLVMAGGVALNSVANGRLFRESPFEQIYIQPNAGDAGGALGAALYAWHVLLGNPRQYVMSHAYYGEAFSDREISRFLHEQRVPHERLDDEQLVRRVVEALCEQKVVALFQGRGEWGPRALGNRSILADPRRAEMKDVVNSKIKFREPFRPFAPVVPEGDAPAYFELGRAEGQFPPRFMLIVTPVHSEKESEIPAVSHMGTARLQTITRDSNPFYYDVVRGFGDATGVPVVLNTSFNLRSEPMVASPADAFRTFTEGDLDLLVMGRHVVSKSALASGERLPASATHAADGASSLARHGEWLVCPACQGSVTVVADGAGTVACTDCRRRFPFEDGIPLLYWPTEDVEVDDVTELVKSFYEENPFPGYEGLDNADVLQQKARRGIFARLVDNQVPDDAVVLEVGCGTGQFSNFLSIRGRTVFGADLCLNSLRLAREFSLRSGLDSVHFLQMNLFRPVFREKSFDVVICNGVLHHTPDPFGGFESIARLVRPGGHIIIGLYNKWGRLTTDIRRLLFRLSGDRLHVLDPYLRSDAEEHRKRIWFMDQYRNPHESKHTVDEVLHWFDEAGFEFDSAIPKPTPFSQIGEWEALFRPSRRATTLEHVLAQFKLALIGGPEGGFFTMIGQRKDV